MVAILPSLLSADFGALGDEIARVEPVADGLHLDVMDGHFVPNLTIGPAVVRAVRRRTRLPLYVHLMIEQPERFIPAFAEAGASCLIVHVETCPHLHRAIQQIQEAGVQPGVTLNPATPFCLLGPILPEVAAVLVMSVNPGFGGQQFLPLALGKIAEARQHLDRIGSAADLQVDGGLTLENCRAAVKAGARTLVAGSAIFGAADPGEAVRVFRDRSTA
jgi:ribulose-phosphate 3-epimerase